LQRHRSGNAKQTSNQKLNPKMEIRGSHRQIVTECYTKQSA
jgi:hypothetical protein